MDELRHGKKLLETTKHLKEAAEILEMGVAGELSEHVALLCADTQLLLAEIDLADARRSIERRMKGLKNV